MPAGNIVDDDNDVTSDIMLGSEREVMILRPIMGKYYIAQLLHPTECNKRGNSIV